MFYNPLSLYGVRDRAESDLMWVATMPNLLARELDTTLVIIIGSASLFFQPWHILCDIYRAATLFDLSILPLHPSR